MTTALIRSEPHLDLLFAAHLLCDVCGERPWTQRAVWHPWAVCCVACAAGEEAPEPVRPTDDQYRQWAIEECASDLITLDAEAPVRREDDAGGAWVQAWIFIEDRDPEEETP
jgi:hypothetical protein